MPKGSHRRAAGRVSAAASVLALLGTAAGLTANFAARTTVPRPDAARFFATDPRWYEHHSSGGNVDWVASAVSAPGLEFVGSLPSTMAEAVRELSARHTGSAAWTSVTTLRYPDGQHYNIPEVFIASAAGIDQPIAPSTLPIPLRYEPALRILPSRIAVGEKWSQEGSGSYSGIAVLDYTADNTITRVGDDGCVDVASHTILTPTESGEGIGASALDDTSTTTYCPGRWVTALTGNLGTQKSVDSAAAHRAMADYAAPVSNAGSVVEDDEAVVYTRAMAGPASADAVMVPGAGVLVDTDGAAQVASGIVADSALIFPVWRLPAAAPFVATPVAAGERLLLADSAGVVTALDPATGFVTWQQHLDVLVGQLAVDPANRFVAALDRSGHVTVLDVATGARVARIEGPGAATGVAMPVDGVVVTGGSDGVVATRLTAVASATTQVYSTSDSVLAGPVGVGGGVAFATDRGEIMVLDGAGAVRARRHLGFTSVDALAGHGNTIALSAGGRLSVLDTGLTPQARLTDTASGLTVNADGVVTATTVDGRVRVFGPDGQPRASYAVPLRPGGTEGTGVAALQRSAAVTAGDVTYVAGATGIHRLAGGNP